MVKVELEKQNQGRQQRLWSTLGPYVLVAPALIVLLLLFLGPAIYNFILSFQNISFFELSQGGSWVGLENYRQVLQDPVTRLSFFNTLFWLTAVTVAIRLVLGMGLALLVNLPVLGKYRMSALARSLLLLPWVTPPVVAVAAWQWILHPRYGAINQLLVQSGAIFEGIPFFSQTTTVWWALVAMIVWREVPFVAISFLAGLQSIPTELYEAARIDGANGLNVFRFMTLPLMLPVIGIVGLLSVIWTFNNFLYVWIATRGGPGTFTQVLATQLYTEAFFNYRMGLGAAIGVFMSLLMMFFAIFYFRFVLRGRLMTS